MAGSPYSPAPSKNRIGSRMPSVNGPLNGTSSATRSVITAGVKRKRGEPKLYSVRAGHRPGVYHTWADCLEQVKGFKKAIFKSFTTLSDAEAFLVGHDPSYDPGSSSFGATKYYGVRNGRVPGVYTDWPSAQEQITGWTKPKHRCFPTLAEAEAFVEGRAPDEADNEINRENTRPTQVETPAEPAPAGHEPPPPGVSRPPNKRARTMVKEPSKRAQMAVQDGSSPSPPISQYGHAYLRNGSPLVPGTASSSGFGAPPKPHTGQVGPQPPPQSEPCTRETTAAKSAGILRIYTDGSSLGNGQRGAVSGVGVYFGANDDRNVSEGLAGPRQTNQRAELTAVYRALEIAPRHREVCIYTDSSYSINCVTVWCANWGRNNWRTSTGRPVENRDLIEEILHQIDERDRQGVKTSFQWVKGHGNDPGNVAADQLAVNGARHARA